MSERPFTLADEAAFHAAALPGLIAGNALQARINALPVRTRLAVYRDANAGGDLLELVAAAEAAP